MGSALKRPAKSGRAGVGQGITIVLAGFLPILAIVSLAPAVPSMMGHFAKVPNSPMFVPLIVTAPGLMIALLSPLMGWAADRFGRRPVMVWGAFLYALFGAAPMFMDGLVPIFVTRLGVGVAEAAILTVVNTLLGDYYDVAKRRFWLAVQAFVGPIIGTSVIALGGALTAFAWNGAFEIYLAAIPIFLATFLFIYEPARSEPPEQTVASEDASFPWWTVIAYSLVTLFSSTIYYVYTVQSGLAFEAVGVKSPATLGLLLSIASVGVPFGAILFGVAGKRVSPAGLIAIYLGFVGAGMVAISLSTTPQMMTGVAMIQQVGSGMLVPSLILWATGSLSPQHRGKGMGFWSAAFFLGQFTSPLFVNVVRAQTGGMLDAFAAIGSLALVGAALALLVSLFAAGRRRRLANAAA